MNLLFCFTLCRIVPFSCNAQMTKIYMQMKIVSTSYNIQSLPMQIMRVCGLSVTLVDL
jgi:hypothetical protein